MLTVTLIRPALLQAYTTAMASHPELIDALVSEYFKDVIVTTGYLNMF